MTIPRPLQRLSQTFDRWSDNIIGRAEDHTLEHRTARTACFLAAVVGFISIGINISISAASILVIANTIFFIIFLWIYFYIRYKGKSSEVYWIIIIVCNATFAIAFFNDEGAIGPTMYFWLFLVMFVSIAGGRNKKYMLALTIFAISLMYGIEWFYPEVIQYHTSRADSFFNIYFSVILCSLFGYIWINAIITNYFNERDKVIRQKAEIEQQKDVIEDLSKRERMIHEMRLNFFTNLSHEFRTPLSLIYVTLDKLKDLEKGSSNEKRTTHYDILYRYAGKLNQLVDEALEFRKLDSGKANLEISRNDIISFVKEITNSFIGLADTRSIKLKFNSAISSFEMGFDVVMMEKVIYNLLSNAIKFTPQDGSVLVNISMEKDAIKISVKDTGIGIPKEYAEEIFKPFYQVPGTKQGTGIGLALTYEYVKLHQGEIVAISALDSGTQFIIRLPVNLVVNSQKVDQAPGNLQLVSAPNEITSQEVKDTSVINGRTVKIYGTPKKILIVEDNEDIVAYLTDFLTDQFQVFSANNGEDGFEKTLLLQPDLVISDVMMPRMYGTDLCQKLKSDIATSHIPVLLLTARTSIEHKIQGFEVGADDYIAKPFDRKLLLARVINLITSRERLKEVYSNTIKINPTEITTNPYDKQFLEKVIAIVEANLDDSTFSLDTLADNMNMSRSTFYRKIKALTNESGDDFIRSVRFKKAVQLLSQRVSIAEVSYSVGFSDPKYFSKSFKKHYGCIPSEFLKQPEVQRQLQENRT
jgi:signal transduction histidine kinase/DNA-binding response OmpR family regulator